MTGHTKTTGKRHVATLFRRQGFSLVSAIFLLVALAGLGAAIVNISTVHQTTSALDVQGARAYQAARAGIEWGLYQQLVNNSCVASSSFALPANTSLSSFTVTVNCTKTAGPAAAVNLDRWLVTATACNEPASSAPSCPNAAGSSRYMQRVLQVQF